ncbi:hypothetical protein ACFPL7_06870 [Dongia soli]|uniref:Motility protein B-like N-terminal domain-containing protein n=1 Tax=Dongia soli TaxID=600628 RepID=A0ABU5E9E1_9PROT|nr:hypothetical protein [Dongia soli]MDY0882664.1 hypothetical protein [Dongia soli]
MTGHGPQIGPYAAPGVTSRQGSHPAAPVVSAVTTRLDNLPQMTFRQAGIRNPSLPTLLSLFFLLLAFFIVLNSLSRRDAEKEHIAASSVGRVFGESEGAANTSTDEDDDSRAATGILKGLASYFGSLIPTDQQKVIISTNQLIIRLPSTLFFRDGNSEAIGEGDMLTKQTPAILRQINETLDRRPTDWGCELDLEIAAAEPGEREIARAGRLAQVLRSAPSQQHNALGVSLINGDPAWLTIVIRLRQPDLPALPGSPESGQGGQPGQVGP